VLTTAAGVHTACVAEHAFGLLLACTRRLGESVRNMTERQWMPSYRRRNCRQKPVDRRHGANRRSGRSSGTRVGALHCRYKARSSELYGLPEQREGPDDLRALCEWADIVVLTAPSTSQTRNLDRTGGVRALRRWVDHQRRARQPSGPGCPPNRPHDRVDSVVQASTLRPRSHSIHTRSCGASRMSFYLRIMPEIARTSGVRWGKFFLITSSSHQQR
jgi:hypothetical protein